MNEQSAFEARLARTFAAYADRAPAEVDASELAGRIARRSRFRLGIAPDVRVGRNAWLVPVLIGLLIVALAANAILIGSLLLERLRPHPTSWEIRPVGTLVQERSGHTATRLADGRVLIAGGWNGWNGSVASLVELYDPATGAFTALESGWTARQDHTATLLVDGRVLIAGGSDDVGSVLSSVEIFDPATSTFAGASAMNSARAGHVAVLLRDGRVAVIGGFAELGSDRGPPVPVELFDPQSGAFTALTVPSAVHGDTPVAAVLPDGRVLASGLGRTGNALIDPVSGSMVELDRAPVGSVRAAATLADGRAIVAGDEGLAIFDPRTGGYTAPSGLMPGVVLDPAVVPDGRVLVTLFRREACESLVAALYGPVDASLTDIGPVPGVGGCNGIPGTRVTSLADGNVLFTGGNTSGGTTTNAVSLLRPEPPLD